MKIKHRWLVTVGFLALACACYFIGSVAGFGLFLVLGVIFELAFWFKLFKADKDIS